MTETPPEGIAYPYGARPLLPAWHSLKGRALAALAAACAGIAATRASLAGVPVNDVALLMVVPGILAFTLAFAPEPRTRLGTMAKDLLCMATALSPLAYEVLYLLILAVPLLLAGAVAMDRMLPPGLRVPERFRALSRILERRNLAWALAGWALRLPALMSGAGAFVGGGARNATSGK